ncbi:MAG: hypothetical protein KDI42_01540 [Gammaproteobacteria bacterium]|nr:hypothetical protein [Gammaproteobacteria bacterium]
MDETEYRQTYRAINDLPCVFQKAILTRTCACSRAHRFCLAEREGVACTSPAARDRCADFLHMLRENARFAMGVAAIGGAMAHGKEMKLQCGGLRGLQHAVSGVEGSVEDVSGLLDQGLARHGVMADLPFAEIVQGVAEFKNRRRSRHRD